jgi:hypothetical protein
MTGVTGATTTANARAALIPFDRALAWIERFLRRLQPPNGSPWKFKKWFAVGLIAGVWLRRIGNLSFPLSLLETLSAP